MAKRKHSELAIGGQAVIEGVMMRSKEKYSIAVSKPNGKIKVMTRKSPPWTSKNRILGLPFIRGVVTLVETMALGVTALNYSADEADTEKPKKPQRHPTIGIVLTLGFSLVFALLIFKFIPLMLATFLAKVVGGGNFIFNLIDGIMKITILVIYLLCIAMLTDVRRMFQYHGAEHKAVSCHEKGRPLTVENIRKESTAHPRCGTSFIIIVMLLSIVFYMLIPIEAGFWAKFGLRILFLPFIAALSYEIIRLAGKHPENAFVKVLIWPSMFVQRLTTREPDNRQMEVAAAALKAVL